MHRVKVESLKYSGTMHRWWSAWLLQGPEGPAAGAPPAPRALGRVWVGWTEAGGVVTEGSGRTWVGRDPMFLLFWPGRWYNSLVWTAGDGNRFYCNISTPPVWDADGVIRYTDLDLDLMVFPNGFWRVQDRDEFNVHKERYAYPPEVIAHAEAGLQELIRLRQQRRGPFAPESVHWLRQLLAVTRGEG